MSSISEARTKGSFRHRPITGYWPAAVKPKLGFLASALLRATSARSKVRSTSHFRSAGGFGGGGGGGIVQEEPPEPEGPALEVEGPPSKLSKGTKRT